MTGLDYYNARWYDPVSGQFLSPDSVQGNAQGMDPYAYVGNDPEARVDTSGQMDSPDEELGGEAGNGGDDGSGDDVTLSETAAEIAAAADTIESEDSLLQDEQRIDQQRTEQEHAQPNVEQPASTTEPSEPPSSLPGTIEDMTSPIEDAGELLFNVGADGINPGSLTSQEFQFILENPILLAKTIFVFGVTF